MGGRPEEGSGRRQAKAVPRRSVAPMGAMSGEGKTGGGWEIGTQVEAALLGGTGTAAGGLAGAGAGTGAGAGEGAWVTAKGAKA